MKIFSTIFTLTIVCVLLAVNPSWSADEVKTETSHERINEILSEMRGEIKSPSRYLLNQGFSSQEIAKTLESFMLDVQALSKEERVEISPLDDIFDSELDTADVILHSAAFLEYLKKYEASLPSSFKGEGLAILQMQAQSFRESYVNDTFHRDCVAYDFLVTHIHETVGKIVERLEIDYGSLGITPMEEIEIPEIDTAM